MDSFNGIIHIGEAWGKMMGRSLAEADDVFGDDEDYNVTLDDIPGRLKKTREDLRPKKDKITGDPRLPQQYNSRDEYPQCKPEVLNQKICGACWAFSSAGVLEDRFCIHSEGQIKVTLSPQDMVNCDFENFGCTGGYFVPALDFLITEGVTTNQCLKYKNEKEECHFSCDNPKKNNYDKYYCKPGSLKIFTETNDIQREIYNNGPVMVGLMVYEDLYSYKTGVYEYTAGGLIGGHGIRCVGWGHDDDGFLYWICQNQWTDAWGNEGYVNIKAGEIGIDTWALSCMPDIIAEKK